MVSWLTRGEMDKQNGNQVVHVCVERSIKRLVHLKDSDISDDRHEDKESDGGDDEGDCDDAIAADIEDDDGDDERKYDG